MAPTTQINYREDKLTGLILYVAAKCWKDTHYGVLKLNKILFYSDFKAFSALGKPITGAEYRKYDHGPAPAVMKFLKQKLVSDELAYEYHHLLPTVDEDETPMREKQLLARRLPDIDTLFSATEIALVDNVIEWLRPMTGKKVSLMSHRHPGWRLVEMEKTIPYFMALLPEEPGPLSAADMERAKGVAERFEKRSPETLQVVGL